MIRQLCVNSYLGEHTALCRVLGRYKMFVDTADSEISSHLLLDGYWEMWITEAMPAFIRPGMAAIDVGANLGYYSLMLADLVGPTGAVHAFEPNPPIAERLRRTLDLNGFWGAHVHGCALWDCEEDQVELVVPAGRPLNAHIAHNSRRAVAGAAPRLRVATRRLDGFELPSVDFVKIDAEGAEEQIWMGMSGLLERRGAMTVFLEFAAARYASPAAFLGRLLQYGFKLSRVEPSGGVATVDAARVLADPPAVDQMLVLQR